MTTFLVRVAALVAIYLLVLTSIAPGDVLVGSLLAIAVVAATHGRAEAPRAGWRRWVTAVVATVLSTGRDVVTGAARTVRFILGGPANPGFVEIPFGGRSPRGIALWGLLTGEAPDEYPVDVDEARQVLIVHVLDATDPAAIQARHAHVHERWHRNVVK